MNEAAALPLPKKRPASNFSVEDNQPILNIFSTYDNVNPHKTKTQNLQFTGTAAATARSVYNILQEYTDTHELHHRQRVILDNIGDDTKSALKRLIHFCFGKRNEPPTLNKISAVIHENDVIPHFKRNSLWKLMKEIGFRFSKRSRNNILKEKQEIIVRSKIRKHREEDRKFYYLDETWVNTSDTVNKAPKDT